MADVIIIGDGPGALSAALFLAKKDKHVVVFGKDETAMNWAHLYNYLGIPEISGTEFQKVARAQVTKLGATIRDEKVASIAKTSEGFAATTESGETVTAKYLVLSEGKNPTLAPTLDGIAKNEDGTLSVDRDGRTALDRVYAVGRSVRAKRAQAIISAGEGAAVALDILSVEAGEEVWDWDSPPK